MTAAPTERTRVKRLNKRAKYDEETVHGILDASPMCNVGYIVQGRAIRDADAAMARGRSHLLAWLIGQPHAGGLRGVPTCA